MSFGQRLKEIRREAPRRKTSGTIAANRAALFEDGYSEQHHSRLWLLRQINNDEADTSHEVSPSRIERCLSRRG